MTEYEMEEYFAGAKAEFVDYLQTEIQPYIDHRLYVWQEILVDKLDRYLAEKTEEFNKKIVGILEERGL